MLQPTASFRLFYVISISTFLSEVEERQKLIVGFLTLFIVNLSMMTSCLSALRHLENVHQAEKRAVLSRAERSSKQRSGLDGDVYRRPNGAKTSKSDRKSRNGTVGLEIETYGLEIYTVGVELRPQDSEYIL